MLKHAKVHYHSHKMLNGSKSLIDFWYMSIANWTGKLHMKLGQINTLTIKLIKNMYATAGGFYLEFLEDETQGCQRCMMPWK